MAAIVLHSSSTHGYFLCRFAVAARNSLALGLKYSKSLTFNCARYLGSRISQTKNFLTCARVAVMVALLRAFPLTWLFCSQRLALNETLHVPIELAEIPAISVLLEPAQRLCCSID